MSELIQNGAVVADTFTLLDGQANLDSLPGGDLVVPLAAYLQNAERFTQLRGACRIGVLLAETDDPLALQAHLAQIDLIAVNFPKFTDGRGFSIAHLLRTRLNWRGPLRAVGPLLRDQLFYLQRAGFDSFMLREGQDLHAALASLNDFSVSYQIAAQDRVRAQQQERQHAAATA
ncbi:MAG: hypothetical protein RL341_754 [Pseudomonadota bacterium]|jgi:uncharacterized protein (DUF934 family)